MKKDATPAPANGATILAEKPVTDGKVTTRVLEQIETMRRRGGITLPPNYDVANALNSAWLKLQTVVNKENKAVIKNGQIDSSVVTVPSVVNALHDYCIQGLNCSKNQAYFIVYGDQLVCQRSYFGDMHVAKGVRPNTEFFFDVIYKGEEVQVQKIWSKSFGFVDTIANHSKVFPRESGEIIGAYCGAVDTETGENLGMVLFDMPRIRKSWSMSKTYKYSTESKPTTHDQFPEEMAIRTVVRRRTKPLINSSNDSVLIASVRRQDIDQVEGEMDDEVAEFSMREPLAMAPRTSTTAPPATAEATGTPTPEQVQEALGISRPQWMDLKDQLAEKSDTPIDDFLREALSEGCNDFASVSARIEGLKAKGAVVEGPDY